jgi:hypothetical protein
LNQRGKEAKVGRKRKGDEQSVESKGRALEVGALIKIGIKI